MKSQSTKMQLLTKREREIVEMVVEGRMPFKAVAITLKIALDTVHNHIRSIYGKWNVRCLPDLIWSYNVDTFWMIRKTTGSPAPAPLSIIRKDPKVFRMNKTESVYQLKKAS